MPTLRLRLESEVFSAVARAADRMHLDPEDLLYAALDRLMLRLNDRAVRTEVARAAAGRPDAVPRWSDRPRAVQAYESQHDAGLGRSDYLRVEEWEATGVERTQAAPPTGGGRPEPASPIRRRIAASSEELLGDWLDSARAMELSLGRAMQTHAEDMEIGPEARGRLGLRVLRTREHVRKLERCLALIGREPSLAKSALGLAFGAVEAASVGMYWDESVKRFLAGCGAEHFEIAAYKALVAAAEELGRREIAELCRQNLRDEEQMADWLEAMLPEVTRTMLRGSARPMSPPRTSSRKPE